VPNTLLFTFTTDGKSSLIRARLIGLVIGKRRNCWRIINSSSGGRSDHRFIKPPRGSLKYRKRGKELF
jgi:hypothetical protein